MVDKKQIIDMYTHLRTTNSSISDEAIEFMRTACIEKLNSLKNKEPKSKFKINEKVTISFPTDGFGSDSYEYENGEVMGVSFDEQYGKFVYKVKWKENNENKINKVFEHQLSYSYHN